MMGQLAVEGALHRVECQPANSPPVGTVEAKDWDGQWLNWDDLGPGDPGWGDVGE